MDYGTRITGVELDQDIARVTAHGVIDNNSENRAKLFYLFATNGLDVDTSMQTSPKAGVKDISFSISKKQLETAERVLQSALDNDFIESMSSDLHVGKLSLEGEGLDRDPSISQRIFEVLFFAGINIKMIAHAQSRIAVLVDQADAEQGLAVLKKAFGLEE